MLTIVYGHPFDKSFNHAILETALKKLESASLPHCLVDLYADGFDPAVRVQDLALYEKGETTDDLAKKYMRILKKTSRLVFIYPIWWGVEPAIVQGFYDKVLLKDFAWEYSPDGRLMPLLEIEKTTIFTTSEAPSDQFCSYFKDYLPTHVFQAVGMSNPAWHNLDRINSRTEKERQSFLALVEKAVA